MTAKKCIILRREDKILSLLYHGNRLLHADAAEETGSVLGNIYIAKVKHMAKNIHAAFVEIQPGLNCFLRLDDKAIGKGKKKSSPLLLNRPYDGRLLEGDELLVQVTKEASKGKPPAVTAAPSLHGRYCVVSSGQPGVAYSAKLSEKAKNRLSAALKAARIPMDDYAETAGIIIRTNAGELTEEISPLAAEIEQLSCRLKTILAAAEHRTCYSLLFENTASYLTNLRDMYQGQYEEIVTDDEEIFRRISAYRKENPGYHLPEVRYYEDQSYSLAKLYSVEIRLKEALNKKVWLKSGGYLIIEPTEALTVIDVNTGKNIAGKAAEETHFGINMEAAEEIALQLGLRNLSGIIIVDFINMQEEAHNRKLTAHLGDLLKKDTVKTQLVDITPLGLVEITRMKISRPLKEQLSISHFCSEKESI